MSRSTINKWVMIHQGIHNIAPTQKQPKYYLTGMNSKPEKASADELDIQKELQQKIALPKNNWHGKSFVEMRWIR